MADPSSAEGGAAEATTAGLLALLEDVPPFDGLDDATRVRLATAAQVVRHRAGDLVLDGFSDTGRGVCLVLDGHVALWNAPWPPGGPAHTEPDETAVRGDVFGFTGVLTGHPVGPRGVAQTDSTVAYLRGADTLRAFATHPGARFLANTVRSSARSRPLPPYSVVGDLLLDQATVVAPHVTIAQAAAAVTADGNRSAVVDHGDGRYSLMTDATLRSRVAAGMATDEPVGAAADPDPPHARPGEPAAEVLIRLLEADEDATLVLDPRGRLLGVVTLRDFTRSPASADVMLHEQLRNARDGDELTERFAQAPALASLLLQRGLDALRVVAVYSGIVDITVRRALDLVLAERDDLRREEFTWLVLGSNARREAVFSSDLESAVSFPTALPDARRDAYRAAFAQVEALLTRAGLTCDEHGAAARRPAFSRDAAQWRAAARGWVADPVADQGAMMTSLLGDARGLGGEPAPAGAVLRTLPDHPGSMRLLLDAALANRARSRSTLDALTRRNSPFDVKHDALIALTNMARWAALLVRSPELSTPARLRAAAGTAVLPTALANTLVESYEEIQRLRLGYQLMQIREGRHPTDRIVVARMSSIDRSILGQAVREIANAQKRLANIAAYVSPEEWVLPE